VTHPRPADESEIARSVLLQQRLASGADRLESLARDLLEEVRLLREEVALNPDGSDGDDSTGT
jgi:hypothetical protein